MQRLYTILPNGPTLFPLSERRARNLLDAFALAWIFSAVLAVGLMMLHINLFTVLVAVASLSLGNIWWMLSHYRAR